MAENKIHNPGELVHFRKRDWMVLPSDNPELLKIKPLGGSEEEETAVYLPFTIPYEKITSARFPEPDPTQIGSFETARLLYDSFRLSFRNASGPFRCMGKLSFRPRAYQLVPLVMSLKMDITRLLIADDVGIGKTVEALIILKELVERGEVKRFAVICPPHLCEQWQQELKDKLDINAEIIRSSTAAKLDRQLPDDQSVFHHLPYQVVSIDYVKADKRRGIFINDCPEFIIVDEAHTCTLPAGAKSKSQQQRFALLYDLSSNINRQIVLLTATPHSGKDSEFASLLGLLKQEFGKLNFEKIEANERKKLADHFVQRKRESIKRWLNESTDFPERESKEVGFPLTNEYLLFYTKLLGFARGISESDESKNQNTKLLRSWAAISLIKGSMSSPAMAMEMLVRRKEKVESADEFTPEVDSIEGSLFEELDQVSDVPRQDLIEKLDFARNEIKELEELHNEATSIFKNKYDQKIDTAIKLLKEWVKEGYAPIVFCHYIPTANYVAGRLKEELPNNIHIEAITSELADEQRRERIELMGKSEKRILVATDCLSEGINLQEHFTAVLHYDLPWNPNRIEQREGRVDRFGQSAPIVKTYLLYGENNDMDMFILEVLIRKVREIQRSTGVSISIGENSKSIMTEAAQRLLFNKKDSVQQELFRDTDETITNELELARRKGENIRSIFAHETIDPASIKADLEAVDEAIGDIKTVEHFVCGAVQQLGGSCEQDGKAGHILRPQNLPPHISRCFNNALTVKVSFYSPTPKGYHYIGRNHKFTELLCQFLIALSFEPKAEYGKIARVCEVQTDAVSSKTVLVVFRVRNVIKEVASRRESIAEEMYLWGYRSVNGNINILDFIEAKELLVHSKSVSNLSAERQQADIKDEMKRFEELKHLFLKLAVERADNLVSAHSRFRELIGGRRYEKATPVLPPDVMGVYILMPKLKDI